MEKENDNMKSKSDMNGNNTNNIKEPEENLYSENALELSRMSFKEKSAYKRQLQARRLASMDSKERKKYILLYKITSFCVFFTKFSKF